LLKARLPERYSKDSQTNVNVNLANNIQIMPRAGSYEEWLRMKDVTPKVLEGPTVDIVALPLPCPENDPQMADIL
jgi:hypothetical protein